MKRRALIAALAALPAAARAQAVATAPAVASAPPPPLRVQNLVPISPLLITSGQPTAPQLKTLGAHGIEAVIYLAPSNVWDSIRDEPAILAAQGIQYLHIPIDFQKPGERDFDAFVKAMQGLQGRKVLVHCQVNMRASTLVFLYRTIVGKEAPGPAYESVQRIWKPEGPWRKLVVDLLRKNGIPFELL